MKKNQMQLNIKLTGSTHNTQYSLDYCSILLSVPELDAQHSCKNYYHTSGCGRMGSPHSAFLSRHL